MFAGSTLTGSFVPAQRFTQILSLAVIFSMAILFAQGSNYLFFIGLVNIGLTLHSSPLYHSGKTLLPGSESQLIVMALIPHINRSKMRVDSTLLFWLALVKGETKWRTYLLHSTFMVLSVSLSCLYKRLCASRDFLPRAHVKLLWFLIYIKVDYTPNCRSPRKDWFSPLCVMI